MPSESRRTPTSCVDDLEVVRGRILAGDSLADAAAASGFSDQAHLTHRFKRHLGITPGRFASHAAEVLAH